MNALAIILLILACANTSPLIDSIRQEWETFKTTYNKTYEDETEENYRMKIFVEKLINVAQHNARYARGESTFELGVNFLSDMTRQEVVDTMTGAARKSLVKDVTVKSCFTLDPNITVPSCFDWRTKNCVTRVKNQHIRKRECGSCYAFGAVGAMECRHKLKTGKLVSLSEQNLVDCSRPYGNRGCHGGFATYCYDYVKANKGIAAEKSYPYKAVEEKCHYKPKDKGATVTGYCNVTSGDEKALMQAVATKGTLSVGIYANYDSFFHYKSGIYYEPKCSSEYSDLNHEALVVGYGTDKNGNNYWIVKNSWSKKWGEKGYIRMARNRNNNCGIATDANFPLE